MAQMIQQLVDAGASPPVIAIAVSAYEHLSRYSNVTQRDRNRERQRRFRQKRRQNGTNAEANDAARGPLPSVTPDSSHCNVTPFVLSEGKQEKEVSKKGVTRARGTRISPDWQPDEGDRKFATDHGVDPDWLRGEFVDYWVGVPGQRGCKLDWKATWRNRVRDVAGRRKPVSHGNKNDLSAAIAKARQFARRGD